MGKEYIFIRDKGDRTLKLTPWILSFSYKHSYSK